MSERYQIRIHGGSSLPTLIYLPGLHGDWTLVGAFRKALGGRVRFVEVTYPRTLTWSLEDYAAGLEKELVKQGISAGWLLAESFSSQVVWAMTARKQFRIEGLILIGGFVSHPMRWGVRLAERICGGISLTLLIRILIGYAKIARWRHSHSPEMVSGLQEFLERRTELDRQAAAHRLRLIAQNDPRPIVRESDLPVYALTGLFDPIVPWFRVRWWLKRHCPGLREYKVIWRSDHNVLANATQSAAEQVLRWMTESRITKAE